MPLIRGFHSFDDHFTQIPNEWLRDSRLSLKSIGLLAQIMSHSPGWKMSVRSLARANGTGVDTIKSAVLELERYGYLRRGDKQKQNEDGTFADFEWTTRDPFQNPVTGQTHHGETEHKEEQVSIEEKKPKNNERTLASAEFDEFWNEYPKKEGKKPAHKAFTSALSRATFEDILAGVIRYKASDKVNRGYIMLASRWLNEDHWTDYYAPAPDSAASEKLKERRERELEASRSYLAQLKEQEAKATAPVTCPHGKTLALCLPCSKEINA